MATCIIGGNSTIQDKYQLNKIFLLTQTSPGPCYGNYIYQDKYQLINILVTTTVLDNSTIQDVCQFSKILITTKIAAKGSSSHQEGGLYNRNKLNPPPPPFAGGIHINRSLPINRPSLQWQSNKMTTLQTMANSN